MTARLVLKKLFFCVGEYAEYGFDQQTLICYVFACGIWCLADVSSVSCSSEHACEVARVKRCKNFQDGVSKSNFYCRSMECC